MTAEEKWQKARAILNSHPSADKIEEVKQLVLEAVSENHPGAITTLGMMYQRGVGFEKDYAKACECYRKAADMGLPSAIIHLSQMYSEGKGVEQDADKAAGLLELAEDIQISHANGMMTLEEVRAAVKEGDLDAMYQLGLRYQYGNRVKEDIEVASDWWFRAASKGHVPAQHALGAFYFFTKHDTDNGVKWLTRSAEQNFPLSLYSLGDIYVNGWGVDQDMAKGFDLLKRAAELDCADAQWEVASMYHDGKHVKKDAAQAKYWVDKFVAHDTARSHYIFGKILCSGEMYPKDLAKAADQFEAAVKLGSEDALNEYVRMLWTGDGVPKDQPRVLATFTSLAEGGDDEAMFILYKLYLDDDADSKDTEKAVEWLKKAADNDNEKGLLYMGFNYLDDGLFEVDYAKANDYLSRAIEQGNAIAAAALGVSYKEGRGVEKDMGKALQLFEAAAQCGVGYAAREGALILYNGEEGVVEKDIDKAIELLGNAHEDDIEACYLLARMMQRKNEEEGEFSWERSEQAFQLMLKAAEAGHEDAMMYTAFSYLEGKGINFDPKEAEKWLRKLLAAGIETEEVQKMIDQYCTGEPDLTMCVTYWSEIADSNQSRVDFKEDLVDEEGYIVVPAVARVAAKCGEKNAAAFLSAHGIPEEPSEES